MPYASWLHINQDLPFMVEAMREFNINTRLRVCAFIAEVAKETQSLLYMKECASGNEYDTRTDLGNTPEKDGDGAKYKGRGALEITGHNNYRDCGMALGLDLLSKPELLELPEYAWKASAWWWMKHGLNELADTGNIIKVSEAVNGGHNGLAERIAFYKKALEVIK